jgi:hypothetical protein
MSHLLRGFRFAGLGAAALVALGLLPTLASAEVLAFRNDTTAPIIVQGACIVRNSVKRDRPYLLQPTESCRISLPGNKLITVYNPKMPNQVLYQTTIPANPNTKPDEVLFFSVRYDPVQGKVTIERVRPPTPPR